MSATPAVSPDSRTRPRIVIAGAGPAAQALVRQLIRSPFAGGITMLSSRDDGPAGLLELAALPQVSVRFGQPASYIDSGRRLVATADGLEFGYDQLVIATGATDAHSPIGGSRRCLSYATIDDAGRLGEAVKDITRVLGRRPLGILVGTGTAAGQAEAVLRARGVRPVRTTRRPAAVVPTLAGSALPAAGLVFEDGSSLNCDLVVLAEERIANDALAVSAGLATAPRGGIVIGKDFRTSVPGIWAVGDAAVFDGVRLGLVVASGPAASLCASQLLQATLAEALAEAA
jgi:3-phenylpropionate/trans-cinnamate dioxygenase ferredoxin reductase subunit